MERPVGIKPRSMFCGLSVAPISYCCNLNLRLSIIIIVTSKNCGAGEGNRTLIRACALPAWKAGALPMDHSRVYSNTFGLLQNFSPYLFLQYCKNGIISFFAINVISMFTSFAAVNLASVIADQ